MRPTPKRARSPDARFAIALVCCFALGNNRRPISETERAPLPINPALKQLDEKLLNRIPLVVGVTGHRDLRPQDLAALKAAVSGTFHRLRKEYLADDTTPV